jgi:hypothetical protein
MAFGRDPARVEDDHALEQFRRTHQRAEADRAAPILPDIDHAIQIELAQRCVHPADVVIQRVLACRNLGGEAQPDHGRHDQPHPIGGEFLPDLAVQQAIGRVAMLEIDRHARPGLQHVDLDPRFDLDEIALVAFGQGGCGVVRQGEGFVCARRRCDGARSLRRHGRAVAGHPQKADHNRGHHDAKPDQQLHHHDPISQDCQINAWHYKCL